MKASFLVTAPPADEPRIQTMFGYAIVAAAMGYETLVFLTLDAAMLVKRRVAENLTTATRDRMREAMNQDVKVVVCSSAINTYGIKKEDMLEGIDIWGIASFYEHAHDSEIVLTW